MPEQQHEYYHQKQSPLQHIKLRIFPVTEGVAPQTGVFYQRALNHFKDFIKNHDDQVLLDFSPKVIKQMIVDYIMYLRDEKPGKKLSRNSIKGQISGILHFFQINNDDFNLTSRNFKIYLPSDDTIQDDRPYSRDEIAQILKDCDKRSKAVIHLLCAGLRIGAVHSMQVGDLIEINYQGIPLYKVRVYARTRSEYYTFTPPEAYTAIREYLDDRTRNKEHLKDKSPLIREQFNKDNPFTIDSPRFVTQKAIEWLIDDRLQKSGVRRPHEIHMAHGMRKYFMTQCELSGMKSINVETLMGHSTGVSKRYYRPAESDVLEDYMTHAADALTIDKSQKLQRQIEKLETERDQEIELLRQKDAINSDAIANLSDKINQLLGEVQILKQKSG